jgi:adenylate kinase family enzyme
MQKILVIGSCGSGKSTFSRRLGELIGLPVIHLDRHFWRPGWVEPPKDVWRTQVEDLLKGDRWIIDGNYGGTMELRLAQCDTAIFLDFPRHICTWRVIKRVFQNYGRSRPDIGPGCHEKIDVSFIKWTWNYPTRSRPRVVKRLDDVSDRVKITTLTSDRDVENYLDSFKK